MFTDLEKNKEMIFGAYKKLKSYYHYNKNFVFMKQKVSELEFDANYFDKIIIEMAELLASPNNHKNIAKVENWINEIDFYVMPKAFVDRNETNDLFVTSNVGAENKAINKVNFFINMPIELHLLDTLWTVLVGKLIFEKEIICYESYGNSIDNNVLYNKSQEFLSSINFLKNKLFKIYFNQYCAWKNNAILAIEEGYKNKKSQIMFSLDIKGFYYSALWKFEFLDTIFGNDDRYIELEALTNVIQRIFDRYTRIISQYRTINQNVNQKEYIFPIGLFSSMLLANVYLSSFDNKILGNQNILFYGRYVDDMIIVIDVSGDENNINNKTAFDKYLVQDNHILENTAGNYTLCDYPTLTIQRDKVKMIYFAASATRAFISQLKKALTYPSQMNVIPKTELNLEDFEEAIYAKNSINTETKLRNIGHIEIDKFQLGRHMSQIVINNKIKRKYITKEEKDDRLAERNSILKFFVGSKALEYSSNWINALYYFLLTTEDKQYTWKIFESNIREAIHKLTISQIEELREGKGRIIKSRMKKDLETHFDICVSTALAVNPQYSRKEKKEIVHLALKLRKANLFNHYLVSFPLINYTDSIDDTCDLTDLSIEMLQKVDFRIQNSAKSKLSPRFVYLDEIFRFVFRVQSMKGGNHFIDSEKYNVDYKLQYIKDYFYSVNYIHKETAEPIDLEINNIENNGYLVQEIKIGAECPKKDKIKIAIANIKIDTKRACFGLPCANNVKLNRIDLTRFMEKAYAEGKVENKADFLIFPEFYMPLQWISDVLTFVRKSGITVISGLQYITYENQAFNNVAIFSPIKTKKYKNAVMLVREKNNYARLEKEILALEKHICKDQDIPLYQIVRWNGIEYGIFLCYEFTDIIARSLYKNKVDMLFVPECNNDTSYFSSIIESTVRDLHVFIAQANTSIYGDSRITGPYGKNDRDVLQIKGGDEDDIIIGTIDINKVRENRQKQKDEFEQKIRRYLQFNSVAKADMERKYFKEHEMKVAKTSARFNRE